MGLLNVDGYFNSLLTLFDKGVEEGFIDNSARHIVVIADTAEELIKKMEVWQYSKHADYDHDQDKFSGWASFWIV